MSLAQSMLLEFDHEMAGTRKVIERIPADKLDWKANEKSNSVGWNACHLSEIPAWGVMALTTDSFDVAPPGATPYQSPKFNTPQEIVANFDKSVSAARAALNESSDADMMKPWSLLKGGQAMFTMPKIAVLRTFVISHMIHHRAILTVYLRLNDVPVPALYGPSADDSGM